MLSTQLRFGVIALALLCTACGTSTDESGYKAPDASGWVSYDDLVTGVSLSYPNNYLIEPTEDTQITDGTTTYTLQQLRLRKAGDAPLISVLKSDSRSLLLSLTKDRALQTVTVGGKELRKFTMEGLGSPMGYILQEEPTPIVIAFSYLGDQSVIDHVMASVTVTK